MYFNFKQALRFLSLSSGALLLATGVAACLAEPESPEEEAGNAVSEEVSAEQNDPTDGEEDVGESEQPLATWRSDQVAEIRPSSGFWGDWKQTIYCSPGMWATGYKMRVEKSLGSGDDTALNSVQLHCRNPKTGATEWISSYDGLWGDWHSPSYCTGSNNYLQGGRVSMESPQGSGDDTAANDVEMSCSLDGTVHAPGGQGWGTWSSWAVCPPSSAVCGLSIRFEASLGSGDDTAMNGLDLKCCAKP